MKIRYLQNLMSESEKILLVTRQHWFMLFQAIVLEIFLILLLGGGAIALTVLVSPLGAIAFALLLVPVIGMARDILIWYNRQYIVTNRRVIQISGVVNKNVIDSSLEKVNDVKMKQSFWGRLFDFGDIEILTASELGANLFRRIEEPTRFKIAMLNAKEQLSVSENGFRSQAEPVTADVPAMIEELDGLVKKGIITEEEFIRKKGELLSRM